MITLLNKFRHQTNYWLWSKGWATRKQYKTSKPHISYEKAVMPLRGRWWLLLGICIGYVPYVVHMQGWLR